MSDAIWGLFIPTKSMARCAPPPSWIHCQLAYGSLSTFPANPKLLKLPRWFPGCRRWGPIWGTAGVCSFALHSAGFLHFSTFLLSFSPLFFSFLFLFFPLWVPTLQSLHTSLSGFEGYNSYFLVLRGWISPVWPEWFRAVVSCSHVV